MPCFCSRCGSDLAKGYAYKGAVYGPECIRIVSGKPADKKAEGVPVDVKSVSEGVSGLPVITYRKTAKNGSTYVYAEQKVFTDLKAGDVTVLPFTHVWIQKLLRNELI